MVKTEVKNSYSQEEHNKLEARVQRFEGRKERLEEECINRGLYKSDSESISDSDSDNSQEDSGSNNQPNAPESFPQDSSDITGDTEPYDITGGEDS